MGKSTDFYCYAYACSCAWLYILIDYIYDAARGKQLCHHYSIPTFNHEKNVENPELLSCSQVVTKIKKKYSDRKLRFWTKDLEFRNWKISLKMSYRMMCEKAMTEKSPLGWLRLTTPNVPIKFIINPVNSTFHQTESGQKKFLNPGPSWPTIHQIEFRILSPVLLVNSVQGTFRG